LESRAQLPQIGTSALSPIEEQAIDHSSPFPDSGFRVESPDFPYEAPPAELPEDIFGVCAGNLGPPKELVGNVGSGSRHSGSTVSTPQGNHYSAKPCSPPAEHLHETWENDAVKYQTHGMVHIDVLKRCRREWGLMMRGIMETGLIVIVMDNVMFAEKGLQS
jgi:hypothetical protein